MTRQPGPAQATYRTSISEKAKNASSSTILQRTKLRFGSNPAILTVLGTNDHRQLWNNMNSILPQDHTSNTASLFQDHRCEGCPESDDSERRWTRVPCQTDSRAAQH